MSRLLHALFARLDGLLAALPLASARWFALALLLVPLLLVLVRPREWATRGAPDRRPFRDLRLWALVATLPYLLIYLFA